ncbi:efflux RND transporter permease subunit [Roseicyclus marinus]|uniref:efflux RND transporter permease subunit n=1 Tax=Roseicyclus marinus TaxID=2161673 RepID=UPI00240F3B6D|nr:efflux RND transporter permease subunit [Roseicyclus marinus]MDG3040644.1 efflux RND transporter permease subunit [Roseicyclus marinus]
MQIARLAIERPLYTWLLILFCVFGGLAGYVGVGKLEDPAFTLKSALVLTPYPGATAQEVATEVSEVLEAELQQMGEVATITSSNRPGLSVIEVEVRDTFGGEELPQIWDDLRDRIADVAPDLPPGALTPMFNDSYGDVFGLLYAVSAPGYGDADIHQIASFLRREVAAVPGVANAELRGLPEEAIHVEPSSATLAALGVPPAAILGAITQADALSPAGSLSQGRSDLRVEAPALQDSAAEIGALSFGHAGEVLNLTDLARVTRGTVDDPGQIIRHNGVAAFTLGISGLTSENIVTVGAAVEARLSEIAQLLPVGVTIDPIYEQHRVVAEANGDFVVNLALSVGVVIGVLALFMGWRAAVVVGGTLFLNVTFTFFFMNLFDIKVERISLGALIIAMGMLVDNAIVVAEGMQVQMRRGRRAAQAAAEVARRTQVPLLGATIIGILAFAGIGLSPDSSGEFLFSLFAVIGISLLLSWLLAVTVTPLLASYFFRVDTRADAADPYDTAFFRAYGLVVRGALRLRYLVLVGLIGAFVAGGSAMGLVKQQFFPPATTPLVYLNYMAAQGTSIAATSEDLARIEGWLLEREEVTAVTTTVGGPMTRFLLTYTPEDPNPAYGQIVIRVEDHTQIPALRDALSAFAAEEVPWAETRVQQIIYGPPVGADVEVRLSGPDAVVLRGLAAEAQRILETETDLLTVERTDWRDRELVTRPIFAADRAQALGIARGDVAQAVALATDGVQAGAIREGDRLIPVIVRTPRAEQVPGAELVDQLVYAPVADRFVSLDQVVDGFEVIARDTLVQRRNRVPTISVQAFAKADVLPAQAFAEVRAAIEAMELPPGYRMAWGGEYESASTAQASLGRQMPLAFGAMLLITLLLFGKLRQTLVIWTVVPMAVTGVGLGLLWTGLPFSFTALLGLLSLSGMLIKNAIVLVEEIDAQKAEEGLSQDEAIVTASISRLRPVLLAAATTILGMTPLLWDAFFASMAVAIMAGLGFASVLTLIGVPAIYHSYLRRERRAGQAAVRGAEGRAPAEGMARRDRLAAE